MPKKSAGPLLFRELNGQLEVLLVHPGGPFWAKKDRGAWSIPKGEFEDPEEALAAAKREVEEEIGFVPATELIALDPVRQPGGKVVYAWAIRADLDPARVRSNNFSLEWPPRSGEIQKFPEIDRAAWFVIAEAERKILKGQIPLLRQLRTKIRM